jgi:hypothetical protein
MQDTRCEMQDTVGKTFFDHTSCIMDHASLAIENWLSRNDLIPHTLRVSYQAKIR